MQKMGKTKQELDQLQIEFIEQKCKHSNTDKIIDDYQSAMRTKNAENNKLNEQLETMN